MKKRQTQGQDRRKERRAVHTLVAVHQPPQSLRTSEGVLCAAHSRGGRWSCYFCIPGSVSRRHLYLDLRKVMLSQDLPQGKALPVSHGSWFMACCLTSNPPHSLRATLTWSSLTHYEEVAVMVGSNGTDLPDARVSSEGSAGKISFLLWMYPSRKGEVWFLIPQNKPK